jgi:hypothetical protein
VVVAAAEALNEEAGLALGPLARVIQRIVVVTIGSGQPLWHLPDGIEVVRWLGDDGFGIRVSAPAARAGVPS